jgi:hypothetical protein
VDLPGSAAKGSWAHAIYVSGDDVYASGEYQDGANAVACAWIGSARKVLPIPDPDGSSFCNGMFVVEE